MKGGIMNIISKALPYIVMAAVIIITGLGNHFIDGM